MPANKKTRAMREAEKKAEQEVMEQEAIETEKKAEQEAIEEPQTIKTKTIGLFTKQMKDWGYESKEEFANEIIKHEIGDVIDGKKVTKLLKERAQLIIEG